MRYTLLVTVFALPFMVGCVKAQPATDTGDSVISTAASPTSPTPTTPVTGDSTLAFNPDIKALLQTDCVNCHGASRADAGYRATTYAQTMAAVRAGSASSVLVQVTQSGGSMYRYWSGSTTTRQSKAAQLRSWVVNYNAQENR